jgi:hypothetical protein
MSEVFEGIVIPRAAQDITISGLTVNGHNLEVLTLARDISVAFRNEPRAAMRFTNAMETVAESLSEKYSRALLVRYDSRISHRSSIMYGYGTKVDEFAGDKELFVPLGERGLPILTARPLLEVEFEDGVEYETCQNAIQLGLAKCGWDVWEKLFDVMVG